MDQELLSRRDALGRAAMLLGAAISAPTVAGVLDGVAGSWAEASSRFPASAATLDPQQMRLVATIAEHILPTTDTPGARAAGVDRFVDTLLTSYYKAPERDRFLAGLRGVDVRARRAHGKTFLQLTPRQQVALLTQMDEQAYPDEPPRDRPATQARGAGATQADTTGKRPTAAAPAGGAAETAEAVPEDVRTEMGSGWFFRRIKELTLVGYYTSRVGATQELRVNPMGVFKNVPYTRGGRAWS